MENYKAIVYRRECVTFLQSCLLYELKSRLPQCIDFKAAQIKSLVKKSLKENIGYYFKLGNSYQSYNDVFILN